MEAAAKLEFDFTCNEIKLNLEDRLNASAQLLRSGSALYNTTEILSRTKWRTFAEGIQFQKQLPGIQGVGFALVIPRSNLAAHEQTIRGEGFPDYRVRPQGERDTYSSIIYLEPFSDRNLRAFGYDMLSEPVRREAMERARDRNDIALSGKVVLVQETGREVQAGTLLYVPVYRHGMPVETVAQRRAAIAGWVYSPYRMTDMMRGTLRGWDVKQADGRIYLQVHDGDVVSDKTLLFDSRSASEKKNDPAVRARRLIPIDFGGRRWTLHLVQYGSLTTAADYISVWLVFFGGIVISVLLFGLMSSLINTRKNAQLMAAQLTVKLRESEMTYRTVADFTYDWEAWQLDDGSYQYISPSCKRITGYTPEEFAADKTLLLAITHPDDRTMVSDHYSLIHTETNNQNREFDFRIITATGEIRWISHSCTAVCDEEGRSLGRRVSNRDITQRKLAEDMVQDAHRRLESIIEGTHVGTWEWNIQTGETLFNDIWAQIIGYTIEELSPVSIKTWEALAHPDDLKQSGELLERHFAGEFPYYRFESRMKHKDGSWVWVLDRGKVATWTADGKPLMMFGTHSDITERKIAEAEIKSLLASKEIILREVHHRIKNNMNTIHSLLALQADISKDPSVITALKDAGSRIQSMQVLYNKLYQSVEYSRISVRDYLPSLIDEIVSNFPNCNSVKTEKRIDDFVLDAVKLQPLGIIINELITNIMKYAFIGRDNGAIIVCAAEKSNLVTVSVEDNGNGMPESIDFENSTGFGLMLVGMLVKQLKGVIRIERHQGTKVIFEFEK